MGPAAVLGGELNAEKLLNKAKLFTLQQLQPFEIKPQCTKAKQYTGKQITWLRVKNLRFFHLLHKLNWIKSGQSDEGRLDNWLRTHEG